MKRSKSRDYYDSITDDRLSWAREQQQECMVCTARRVALEIHEIERRSHAPGRWAHPCNYLLTCGPCHSDRLATMPHATQLAIKLLKDPTHYHLPTWLRLRDVSLKAPNRVTQQEVDQAATILRRHGSTSVAR